MKLTRSHFNRKILLAGILGFSSVALISTGFAAFVLSTNAENKQTGNVTVGKIQEESLRIDPVALDKDGFYFEPLELDTSGRIRNDGSNFENLSITVSGEIQNSQYLKKENGLMIKLDVPQGVLSAAEQGYIVLPKCASESIAVNTAPDDDSKPNVVDFSYTVEFAWGSKFNGKNPGTYYDEDQAGLLVDDSTMKTTIEEFRKLVYGLENPNDDPQDGSNQFTITLTASAN